MLVQYEVDDDTYMEKYHLNSFKNMYAKKDAKAINDRLIDQAELFSGENNLDHIAEESYEPEPINKKWPKITSNYKACHIWEPTSSHLAYPGENETENILYFFAIKNKFELEEF